ncbi:hypothetical protein FVA81_08215 [Rhizobium sp. WL3]|uniref:hypothetical protein n=1 Tax=Rhizobium sp. WL3 TaxID=2603277 RepID=UPI0011C1D860|nr:hypothetical protein [Rhizobium sp. WL3]QEE44592.1 hypothetical protein FVA81_08215 [Rhizobium sp. WL3]
MVERISRISRSDATSPTDIGYTLNIGSDADNAWVAARQSQINRDIEERRRTMLEEKAKHGTLDDEPAGGGDEPPSDPGVETSDADDTAEDSAEEPRLSGESERIGTQNFDEDTPFGDRTLIV